MKKLTKKAEMTLIICAILGIGIIMIALFAVIVFNPTIYTTEQTVDYKGREAFFEVREDYFSHLLIFPESNSDNLNIDKYYYRSESGLFDNSYDIYLEYSLDDDKYEAEKKRISELALSYKEQRNIAVKVENASLYEMYVTSWYAGRAYEYVLLDDENSKIVCIYLQLGTPNSSIIPEEYCVNIDVVNEAVSTKYSMYYFKTLGGMDMPER